MITAQRYYILYDYVKNVFCNRILEIGVWKGYTSEELLQNSKNPNVEYVGIDLFELITDEIIAKENSLKPDTEQEVYSRLSKFSKNITLLKGFSDQVFEQCKSLGMFDFIFIDGGHSFETVKKDFELYSSLLSPNGTIFLDDYQEEFGGIKKFVDDYLVPNDEWRTTIYSSPIDHYRGFDFKLVSICRQKK